jgi:endogenous inhibitor of DNA gyrase (YacG/DUF329 family)
MIDLYIIDSQGKRRKAEKYNCEKCDKEFLRRKNGIKRFCSTKCSHKSQRKRLKFNCDNCGKEFERRVSQKKSSKHNVYFCCRKCKDFAQSLKGDCNIIRPNHYGTADDGHKKCKSFIGETENAECAECGEKFEGYLVVHHIDGNHMNNPIDGSNWEIVCLKCHTNRHMKFNGKEWKVSWANITPRNNLEKIKNLIKQINTKNINL